MHDQFKTASGVQSSGPWDLWLPVVKQPTFSAGTAHGALPKGAGGGGALSTGLVAQWVDTQLLCTILGPEGMPGGGGGVTPQLIHQSSDSGCLGLVTGEE